MESLNINGTIDTPSVILDSQNGEFGFSGRSYPENSNKFYQPIIDWLAVYSENPLNDTIFNFKLEYINTSSTKQITKVLLLLEYLSTKCNVKVKWLYRDDDLDMKMIGDRFAKLIKCPIDVESYIE